jgi:MFS family permease
VLLTLEAPAAEVTALATRALTLTPTSDGSLVGPVPSSPQPDAELTVRIEPDGDARSRVSIAAAGGGRIPWFGWFFGPILHRDRNQAARYAGEAITAAVAGDPEPGPRKSSPLLPPVPFSPEAIGLLATVCALAALTNFGGALFGQLADPITDSFGASNRELGVALAVSRAGALVALVTSALADRQGRRRLLLFAFGGVCMANAVSAVAPSFEVFTAAQLMARAFVNAALVVGAIAVIEEAPEKGRAFSVAMLALAAGAGFAVTVALLPFADLSSSAWRGIFAVSALTIVFLPRLARALRESRRYEQLAARTNARGRVRDVFGRIYGFRFFLLAAAAFLTNVFSAPSSQLTNRYLTDEHGYSNTLIATFRTVTNGLPGLIGIVIAGRLAETRGRKPVGIIALAVGSLFEIGFFLGGGAVLWFTSMVAIVAAACSGLALGTLGTELFPTEVRGTSNGLLIVCGVAGSATGLLLATNLDDTLGGLGPAIALCGIAPLVAAAFVVPFLPEAASRKLDDVSPSEV